VGLRTGADRSWGDEIECPFCGELHPRETARWDERGIGYITICQTCGKVFSGLTLVSAYTECVECPNPSAS